MSTQDKNLETEIAETGEIAESWPDIPVVKEPLTTPEPNIVFVGKRDLHGEIAELEAPASLKDGFTEYVDLPPSDVQKKGFYHENAAQIVRAFPQLYKHFVKKGEK